jgi:hypothetical protein
MSVTVIQHLPHELQDIALAEAARVLAAGGRFVLLEMTRDVAPRAHVFPRSVGGWRGALQQAGFDVTDVRGEAYVPLIRVGSTIARHLPSSAPRSAIEQAKLGSATGTTSSSIDRLPAPAQWALRAVVAASRPVERVAELTLPGAAATHACIVARRR